MGCSLRQRSKPLKARVLWAAINISAAGAKKRRKRKGGGAVERTGLENRQRRKPLVGSNPTPSAKEKLQPLTLLLPVAVIPLRLFPEAAIQARIMRFQVGNDLKIVAPRLRQLDALDMHQA